jgi:two-component system, chemotaxis family, protein-glutamate methylesterase/glutaminase
VLVVDDSAFMRKMIADILQQDSSISVIGTARNGKDAIEKARELQPNVITMDIEMPLMNGLEALKIIMDTNPLPVIMLSSMTKSGAESTIQALDLGAVDFITKPSGAISLDIETIKEEIINKVKHAAIANIESITNKAVEHSINFPIEQPTTPITNGNYKRRKKIVAIGVSTGGPRALQKLLPKLPQNFPAPIVIVQHMPQGFTKSLAERLNKLCNITVKEAENGEFLRNGTAYIAPGNYHFMVKKLGTALTAYLEQSEPLGGHRPAVNKLFYSIASITNFQKIAVVLTGMGQDGALGVKALREQDSSTTVLVESEESSVIFGMPKAVMNLNKVDYVVHIEEMGQTLCKVMEK